MVGPNTVLLLKYFPGFDKCDRQVATNDQNILSGEYVKVHHLNFGFILETFLFFFSFLFLTISWRKIELPMCSNGIFCHTTRMVRVKSIYLTRCGILCGINRINLLLKLSLLKKLNFVHVFLFNI